MKLFIVVVAISIISLPSFGGRIRGGDMPFPIGRIIDFPKDHSQGVWKDELKKKIFKFIPLEDGFLENAILVQMLGLQKNVIAEGIGEVGLDKILTATLRYINIPNKLIHIKIANLCKDENFNNAKDFSAACKSSEMWVSIQVHEENQKFRGSEEFVIKKVNVD